MIIIGRALDGEYTEQLNKFVRTNNLVTDILFAGHSKKIGEYLSALDVFVLTSKREGFSRSLLVRIHVSRQP